jgi:hypothetical protein
MPGGESGTTFTQKPGGGDSCDDIRGVQVASCFKQAVGVMELLEGRAEAISGEFDSEDVSRTLEAYALMERKPGERLMGLLEERVEAISGEFDSDDVSQTLL